MDMKLSPKVRASGYLKWIRAGFTACCTAGASLNRVLTFSNAVIEYDELPVLAAAGILMEHLNSPAAAFQVHRVVVAEIPGPDRVTSTSPAAASALARVDVMGAPEALVSRKRAVIVRADLLRVLPGTGEVKPPNPYTTV